MSATRRHAARLRAVFENAILVAVATAPPAITTACSSGGGSNAAGADAASDVSVHADARTPADADLDGGRSLVDSPWAPGCEPGPAQLFDGGTDGQSVCDYGIPLPCGLPPWVTQVAAPLCLLNQADCREICHDTSGCRVANGFGCDDEAGAFVAPDGSPILIECDFCPNGVGRRPAGLVATSAGTGSDPVGAFLARCAYLEAASVDAFRTVARELRGFGAPRALVERARRSARDEVRHARTMTRLARAMGCEPARPRVVRAPPRSLLDFAVENAREGCVHETFGALVATWQAAHARDRRMADVMKRIAADEMRHAALAWSIAAWAGQRLDRRGREIAGDARRDAAGELRRQLTRRPDAALVREAGLPTRRVALTLHRQLLQAMWC